MLKSEVTAITSAMLMNEPEGAPMQAMRLLAHIAEGKLNVDMPPITTEEYNLLLGGLELKAIRAYQDRTGQGMLEAKNYIKYQLLLNSLKY